MPQKKNEHTSGLQATGLWASGQGFYMTTHIMAHMPVNIQVSMGDNHAIPILYKSYKILHKLNVCV